MDERVQFPQELGRVADYRSGGGDVWVCHPDEKSFRDSISRGTDAPEQQTNGFVDMIIPVDFSVNVGDSHSQPFYSPPKRRPQKESEKHGPEAVENIVITDVFELQYPKEQTLYQSYIEEIRTKRLATRSAGLAANATAPVDGGKSPEPEQAFGKIIPFDPSQGGPETLHDVG